MPTSQHTICHCMSVCWNVFGPLSNQVIGIGIIKLLDVIDYYLHQCEQIGIQHVNYTFGDLGRISFDEKDLEHMKLIARTQAGWRPRFKTGPGKAVWKLFCRVRHSGFAWGCWQVFGSLPLLADLDAERKVGTLEDLGGRWVWNLFALEYGRLDDLLTDDRSIIGMGFDRFLKLRDDMEDIGHVCFFNWMTFCYAAFYGLRHSMAGSGLIDHDQRSTELSGFDKRW